MRQTYLKISFIFFAITTICSCDKNPYEVDVSGVEIGLTMDRYEHLLAGMQADQFESDYEELRTAHPQITEAFVEQILRAGRVQSPRLGIVKQFVLDTNTQQIIEDVKVKYDDISNIEAALREAFKHVKYYFPNDTLPSKAYTLVSGFVVPGFTYRDILGISLDWYMGKGYDYYHPQQMPMYMQRRMNEDYIVPQVIKAYFTEKYPLERNTDGTLLSDMIYYGKQMEFVRMMMPELPDSIIMEYTKANMTWCAENEVQVYDHFTDNDLWYDTDQKNTSRYLTDGPYTVAADVPIESAPRLGQWLGWQIVKNYVKNSGESPASVFGNNDAQDVFKKARYKP